MNNLTKLILKLKLSLGMLILLLRGAGEVKGQEIIPQGTCYRGVPPRPRIYLHGDFSFAKNWQHNDNGGAFTIQLGHNRSIRTHGVRFDYQKDASFFGPYLRIFPNDRKWENRWDYGWSLTSFVETAVLFPLNKDLYHNSISVSYGIIYSDKIRTGIELFQSFRSDITTPEGFNMYTGIRFHYYFVDRSILVLKRRKK